MKYTIGDYMKKLFALLTLAICLSFVSQAFSNPYYSPCNCQCVGRCDNPCVGQCEPSCGGFYVGAFGSANFLHISKVDDMKLKNRVGFAGGLSLGYKFRNSFRLEGEVAYRHNSIKGHGHEYYLVDSNGGELSYRSVKFGGSSHSLSYMANLLYDFDCVSRYIPKVVPYLGFGIGYSHNFAHLKTPQHLQHKHWDGGFAYQGIAGVGYSLTDTTTLAVEYRYFHGSKNCHDNSIGLAIRQAF